MADVNKMRALAAIETLLEGFLDLKEQVRAITDKETAQDCPVWSGHYHDVHCNASHLRAEKAEMEVTRLRAEVERWKNLTDTGTYRSLNKELEKVRMERDAAQRTLIAIRNMSINTNIS